jgi:hypothetical protein
MRTGTSLPTAARKSELSDGPPRAIYSGRDRLGSILPRDGEYIALDRQGRAIGRYASTPREAASAVVRAGGTDAMNARVRSFADLIDQFRLRCQSFVGRYAAGELDLHETLDQIQADAVGAGLASKISVDGVQAIMAVFGKMRE